MIGTIIQLQKEGTGNDMLSFFYQGNHYVGFLVEKKRSNGVDGTTFKSKSATIRLCDLSTCRACGDRWNQNHFSWKAKN